MGKIYLPAGHDIALALREPNLLVPGKKPVGDVVLNTAHPIIRPSVNSSTVAYSVGLRSLLLCGPGMRELVPGGYLEKGFNLVSQAGGATAYLDVGSSGYLLDCTDSGAALAPISNDYLAQDAGNNICAATFSVLIDFPLEQSRSTFVGLAATEIGYNGTTLTCHGANITHDPSTVSSGPHRYTFVLAKNYTTEIVRFFLDGQLIGSASSNGYPSGLLPTFFNVRKDLNRDYGVRAYDEFMWEGYALSDEAVLAHAQNPYSPYGIPLLIPANQSPFLISVPAGGGVTGDLAAQEAGADTAAVTGTVIVQGDLSAQESGTDTASLNGAVLVSGDLSVQEVGADTAAFDGSATTDIVGDLIVQETGPDTAALTGSITVQGDLSAQETGPDTAAIIGAGPVAVTGDLAAQESGSDTAAIAGLVLVAGTLSVQEIGADGAVINGSVHVSGTLAAQETGADDATFIGTGPVPVTGDLVVQEVGSDHLVIAGYISVEGTLSVQETGPDGAVITGSVLVTGALLATETGADTAAGTGSVIITGDLAVQEIGADTAFLSFEEPGLTGNLIVQESTADKASFLALFPTCHAWSNYDLAQAKLNAALIDVFGESVMFDPTGYQYPVTALFEVTGPENSGSRSRDVQDVGNTEAYRPRPYLLMRTSDVADLDIKARQTVIVRGKNMTVVSDPANDGQCMTMVYVRGDF